MSERAARHPTDEERARDAAPLLARVVAALREGRRADLVDALRADAVWVSPDGRASGPDAVAEALLRAVAGASGWREPVQSGATAVVGFTLDGAPAALTLTFRREGVVLATGAARA